MLALHYVVDVCYASLALRAFHGFARAPCAVDVCTGLLALSFAFTLGGCQGFQLCRHLPVFYGAPCRHKSPTPYLGRRRRVRKRDLCNSFWRRGRFHKRLTVCHTKRSAARDCWLRGVRRGHRRNRWRRHIYLRSFFPNLFCQWRRALSRSKVHQFQWLCRISCC